MAIRISSSLPIKFWLEGTDVFNDTIYDSIEQAKFFAPWKDSDPVKIQVLNTEAKGYALKVMEGDTELAQIPFVQTFVDPDYVSLVEFTFADYAVNDKKVRLSIVEIGYTITGAVTSPAHTASGTIASIEFVITGAVTSPAHTAVGDITNPTTLDFEMELNEAIGATPTWESEFSYDATSSILSCTDNGDTDAVNVATNDTSVLVEVRKTTNAGIAEDSGSVDIQLNGVSESGFPQAFSVSDDMSAAVSHTVTGLTNLDVITVIVTEG